MNLTRLINPLFDSRARQSLRAADDAPQVQRRLLAGMLAAARNTEWGRAHRYGSLASYADFAEAVEVTPMKRYAPW